jgi:hypothetical protein
MVLKPSENRRFAAHDVIGCRTPRHNVCISPAARPVSAHITTPIWTACYSLHLVTCGFEKSDFTYKANLHIITGQDCNCAPHDCVALIHARAHARTHARARTHTHTHTQRTAVSLTVLCAPWKLWSPRGSRRKPKRIHTTFSDASNTTGKKFSKFSEGPPVTVDVPAHNLFIFTYQQDV